MANQNIVNALQPMQPMQPGAAYGGQGGGIPPMHPQPQGMDVIGQQMLGKPMYPQPGQQMPYGLNPGTHGFYPGARNMGFMAPPSTWGARF